MVASRTGLSGGSSYYACQSAIPENKRNDYPADETHYDEFRLRQAMTRHWSSEIRPYKPLVLHVLAASGVFKGATEPCPFWPRNQVLTK